jgi:hypothetical protein
VQLFTRSTAWIRMDQEGCCVLLPCVLGNARWFRIDGLKGVAGLRNYLLDPCLGSGWIKRDTACSCRAFWVMPDGSR